MTASKRARARAARTDRWWAERATTAETPADRAAVAWDRARAAVAHLPADVQPAAWTRLADQLTSHCELRTSQALVVAPNAQTRAGAREATPQKGGQSWRHR